MKHNCILEHEIMKVPYKEEFACNKVLFISYHIDLADQMAIEAGVITLGEGACRKETRTQFDGKPLPIQTVGDQIFVHLNNNYYGLEQLVETFTDYESVDRRIEELENDLENNPGCLALIGFLKVFRNQLPSCKVTGYTIG